MSIHGKQPYRLWYQYLQTCLNNKKYNKLIDKDFYRSWNLSEVKTDKFDKWFKTHSHLFKDYDHKMSVIKTTKIQNNDKFIAIKNNDDFINIEIPKNYSVKRVNREMGALIKDKLNQSTAKFKIMSNRPLQQIHVFDYYLWTWLERNNPKKKYDSINPKTKHVSTRIGGLRDIASVMYKKIEKREQNRPKNMKHKRRRPNSFDEILVSKYIRCGEDILMNVTQGVFPGTYGQMKNKKTGRRIAPREYDEFDY